VLRAYLVGAANAWIGLEAVDTRGDERGVPASVQAQILTRILPFDRGFASRAGSGSVLVELVQVDGDPDSSSAVLRMARALSDIGKVAERPLVERTVAFRTGGELVRGARADGAQVLYLSPGLASSIGAIALALADSGILTFAGVEDFVRIGAVLGVAIDAGKPRISINLNQAKSQNIDFPASVLRLAKVY
jgi:hypothetical protein